MIKRYALSIVLLSSMLGASSQGLVTLFDEEGNVVNGTVVYQPSLPSNVRDTVSIATVVVGTADRDVMVRRYEVWPVTGSYNMFCWGVCYTAAITGTHPEWTSPHPETLSEDEYFTGFHAYYEPTGMTGTARFRYVWYDNNTPDGPDSSWVDIDFGSASGVGLEDRVGLTAELSTGANPTAGGDVVLNYTLADLGQGAELSLFNVLGEKVRRVALTSSQGRLTLPGAGLESGVYFANIVRNGRMLATRRVVISR